MKPGNCLGNLLGFLLALGLGLGMGLGMGVGYAPPAMANEASAAVLRIACAASMLQTLRQALKSSAFTEQEKTIADAVQIIPGSTGRLAQQILQGAPYDLFIAADAQRPQRLLEAGRARRCETFAAGALVVWSPSTVPTDWPHKTLSLAEPRLAPYGRAAQQALEQLGVWQRDSRKLIRGQNVGQAMQFAVSGHVEAALISLEQAQSTPQGQYLRIDPALYTPIAHQICLLQSPAAQAESLWKALRDTLTPSGRTP
jgi:molybdate transport system substrate-binding protein